MQFKIILKNSNEMGVGQDAITQINQLYNDVSRVDEC